MVIRVFLPLSAFKGICLNADVTKDQHFCLICPGNIKIFIYRDSESCLFLAPDWLLFLRMSHLSVDAHYSVFPGTPVANERRSCRVRKAGCFSTLLNLEILFCRIFKYKMVIFILSV